MPENQRKPIPVWSDSLFSDQARAFFETRKYFEPLWLQIKGLQPKAPEKLSDFLKSESFQHLPCLIYSPHEYHLSGYQLSNLMATQPCTNDPSPFLASTTALWLRLQIPVNDSGVMLLTGDLDSGKTTLQLWLYQQALESVVYQPCWLPCNNTDDFFTAIQLDLPVELGDKLPTILGKSIVPLLFLMALPPDQPLEIQLRWLQSFIRWNQRHQNRHRLVIEYRQNAFGLLQDPLLAALKEMCTFSICQMGFRFPKILGQLSTGKALWQSTRRSLRVLSHEFIAQRHNFRPGDHDAQSSALGVYVIPEHLPQHLSFIESICCQLVHWLDGQTQLDKDTFIKCLRDLAIQNHWFRPQKHDPPEQQEYKWQRFYELVFKLPWLQHDEESIQFRWPIYAQYFRVLSDLYTQPVPSVLSKNSEPTWWERFCHFILKPLWGSNENELSIETLQLHDDLEAEHGRVLKGYLRQYAPAERSRYLIIATDLIFMGCPQPLRQEKIKALELGSENLFDWGEIIFQQAHWLGFSYDIFTVLSCPSPPIQRHWQIKIEGQNFLVSFRNNALPTAYLGLIFYQMAKLQELDKQSRLEHLKRAELLLTSAIMNDPDAHYLYYYRVLIYAEKYQLTPNEVVKKELLKDNKDIFNKLHPHYKEWFMGKYKHRTRLDLEAEVELLSALSCLCPQSTLWHNKATILRKLKESEEALFYIEKALRVVPDNPSSWNAKGCFLKDLKRYEESIYSFDKALEIEPNYSSPWGNKAGLLRELGRHEEAIYCLDKALEIEPNDRFDWGNKGTSLAKIERHEEAIHCFDKALEIEPNEPINWDNLGQSLYVLGRHEEAIRCFDKALEIEPNYSFDWSNKVTALAELLHPEQAVSNIGKSISIALSMFNNSDISRNKETH